MQQSKIFSSLMVIIIVAGILQSCKKTNTTQSENQNETKISTHGSTKSHNSGQNCMTCHKPGGSGEGWFAIGGSVYDTLLTSVYPNATVKLFTGANGSGTLKYTIQVDALGNFYTTESIDFGSGLFPAVQGNTSTRFMSTSITTGQCNSCHGVSSNRLWTR